MAASVFGRWLFWFVVASIFGLWPRRYLAYGYIDNWSADAVIFGLRMCRYEAYGVVASIFGPRVMAAPTCGLLWLRRQFDLLRLCRYMTCRGCVDMWIVACGCVDIWPVDMSIFGLWLRRCLVCGCVVIRPVDASISGLWLRRYLTCGRPAPTALRSHLGVKASVGFLC